MAINIFEVAQLISELNPQQQAAALTLEGRYLVIAGAGSGKTKTLVTRIANMLAQGVKPKEIFCATFTNKAAREMKERLKSIVGEEIAEPIWMGTFHSLCVRILRKHGTVLGYGEKDGRCNFTIYDPADCLKTIERILSIMNIDDIKPGLVMHYIENAKNNMWNADHCMLYNAESELDKVLSQLYKRYEDMLKDANSMDFNDLINNVVYILENFPYEAAYWQNRFKFVISDEFQDANPAQLRLLVGLALPQMNIFVVGDDFQSIYAFRGSDIGIILSFQEYFHPCTVLKLEQNYRSTQTIVNAGAALIRFNEGQMRKDLFSKKDVGEPIRTVQVENEYAEAAYVGARIKQLVMNDDVEFGDIAILYRSSYQSQALEQVFRKNFIPYTIIGGHAFMDREEIKDIVAMLRIVSNRKDDAAMLRMLNKPARKISSATEKVVEQYATEYKVSVYRALKSVEDIPTLKKAARGAVDSFLALLDHLEEKATTMKSLGAFVRYLVDHTGLTALYRKRAEKDMKDEERLENIEEFYRMIETYQEENGDKTLLDFLQEMSLLTDTSTEKEEPNQVRMLTVHGSKGLEFPVVFGVGWNEKVFPGWRAFSEEEISEERRLGYGTKRLPEIA